MHWIKTENGCVDAIEVIGLEVVEDEFRHDGYSGRAQTTAGARVEIALRNGALRRSRFFADYGTDPGREKAKAWLGELREQVERARAAGEE